THVNNYGGQDNRNNAAWIGDKMIYGDGDGRTFTSLSGANDVVAHELTHGVTQETANLEYKDQSGALNESFSDVFGYFVDDEDFLMGEDVYTPGKEGDALRSMSNPEQFGQPAHMKDYVFTEKDNGGVHTNSGIPNKAAYNVIQAIGKSKSEQIYYRALT
ncbi:TPA: zinc metalloproteinase aureolysin, partial [Staphylococcus aureus]|nr:zinc metalloproteinase aureolysin [Staphylococcus aureus]